MTDFADLLSQVSSARSGIASNDNILDPERPLVVAGKTDWKNGLDLINRRWVAEMGA